MHISDRFAKLHGNRNIAPESLSLSSTICWPSRGMEKLPAWRFEPENWNSLQVAAVIASLGDLAGAYALPAIFMLLLASASLAAWERALLRAIIPIALLLSGIGLLVSVATLLAESVRRP